MTLDIAVTPLTWKLAADDRYRVDCEQHTVGFIEVVGQHYVVLHGSRYSRAVEISQTRDFERALRQLEAAEAHAHRHGVAA